MFGNYAATAFEIEAERRREVISETMRDVRHGSRKAQGDSPEVDRWTTRPGRTLPWLAATLVNQVGLRG